MYIYMYKHEFLHLMQKDIYTSKIYTCKYIYIYIIQEYKTTNVYMYISFHVILSSHENIHNKIYTNVHSL